ncbi:5-formyltetrahydrofolate cyclo-ligase [Papiliotrema laurentii]|uniref:5-formyltetrahydrofolate cyclo-ligase n=1 Tax=Papiliotrema laurentii TaxID=5418 RepID=A0AAD9CUL2_PAPLA|nr:5-formyltetrahydrofolate cyclo-ligase [Papiliotrema laurentii]
MTPLTHPMSAGPAAQASHPADQPGAMSTMFAIKSALRRDMLRKLRGVSQDQLEGQSQAVFRVLQQQPFYKNARTVGCYLSMQKGELRTTHIVQDLLSSGKKLYTPYLPPAATASSDKSIKSDQAKTPKTLDEDHEPGSENPLMEMLRLYTNEDLEQCPLDKWGILDPGLRRFDVDEQRENVFDAGADDLDLILLPGVAFDDECNRLGRGKAYYDRFLHRYTTARKRPLLIALALTPQILPLGEKIPTTPNDFRLDGVVSPVGVVMREVKDASES